MAALVSNWPRIGRTRKCRCTLLLHASSEPSTSSFWDGGVLWYAGKTRLEPRRKRWDSTVMARSDLPHSCLGLGEQRKEAGQ